MSQIPEQTNEVTAQEAAADSQLSEAQLQLAGAGYGIGGFHPGDEIPGSPTLSVSATGYAIGGVK
jgi:hypothetical protein